MRVKVGTYQLESGKAGLMSSSVNYEQHPAAGGPLAEERTLAIEGEVTGASQSAVDTEVDKFEAAVTNLGFNIGGDVGLTLNDGTTPSAHWLPHANAEGGLKVRALNWGPVLGNEYIVRRKFQLVVSGRYLLTGTLNTVSFSEQLVVVGTSGALFNYQPVINGKWRQVYTYNRSTVQIIQQGQAVGYSYAPLENPPLLPDWEHVERRVISTDSGQFMEGKVRNFVRSWSYNFEVNDNFPAPFSW